MLRGVISGRGAASAATERRLGPRVAGAGLCFSWTGAGQLGAGRGGGSALRCSAEVLDLSVSGARVLVAGGGPLAVGSVVCLGLDSGRANAAIRRVEPLDHGVAYAIEFVWLDQRFEALVHDLVVGDRGWVEERWRFTW